MFIETSPALGILVVAVASLLGNRILSILIGLLLHIPDFWLLTIVFLVDVVQIPLFFWLYENGSRWIQRLPQPFRGWLSRSPSEKIPIERWEISLGGLSVFLIAALPTFGGGIWSATFMAHNLEFRKKWSVFLIMLGSLLSCITVYWVLDTIVKAVRYFQG